MTEINKKQKQREWHTESESWGSHWPMRELHPKFLSLPRSPTCLNSPTIFPNPQMLNSSLYRYLSTPRPFSLTHKTVEFHLFLAVFDPTQTTLTAWHFHKTRPILTKLWDLAKNRLKNWLHVVSSPRKNSFMEFWQEKRTSRGRRISKPPGSWSEGIN